MADNKRIISPLKGHDNHYFRIGLTIKYVLQELLDKYEYFAIGQGNCVFYWILQKMADELNLSTDTLQNIINKYLIGDLGILEKITPEKVKEMNGGKPLFDRRKTTASKRQKQVKDRTNYYLFNFDKMLDDSVITRLIPFRFDMPEWNEERTGVIKRWKIYIKYLKELPSNYTPQDLQPIEQDQDSTTSTATATLEPIEVRERRFIDEVYRVYNDELPKDFVMDDEELEMFINYWTETTPDGSKMGFELEIERRGTFTIKNRLISWDYRDNKF